MTKQQVVEYVASDFVEVMNEEGFETFAEMKQCYMWDSEDILGEIDYILSNTDWYIDEEDGNFICNQELGEIIPYRIFINAVYKTIRQMTK